MSRSRPESSTPSTSEPLAYPAIGERGGLLLDASEVLDIIDDGGCEPGRDLRGSLAPLGAVVVTGELVDDDGSGFPNRVDIIGVLTNKYRWSLVKLKL